VSTRATLVNAGIAAARLLPPGAARALATVAGDAAYLTLAARREILLGNLRHSAPNEGEDARRRLTRQTFRNIARCQADLLRLPSLSAGELLAMVEIRGREHVDEALRAGRGAIGVTGHLGAYELGGAVMASLGYRVHGIAEDLEPEMLAALARIRSATGMELISRNHGILGAYRVLRKGEVLFLVADRVIGDDAGSIEVEFCDSRRYLPSGPAAMSLRTGAPILFGFCVLNPDPNPRYVIEFEPPIFPSPGENGDRVAIVQHLADRMTAAVRRYPDQWFVFQPDWRPRER
jgi:lauroyl/myristoyl acyltransferase